MTRDIVKVRKVGQTLVVTLTQGVLADVPLEEGDRVLIESVRPRRIVISKEEKLMASTRHAELELDLLEKKKAALETDLEFKITQHNLSMPVQKEMRHADDSIMELTVRQLNYELAKLDAEIAEKRLRLFESQGPPVSDTFEAVRAYLQNEFPNAQIERPPTPTPREHEYIARMVRVDDGDLDFHVVYFTEELLSDLRPKEAIALMRKLDVAGELRRIGRAPLMVATTGMKVLQK